MTRPREYDGDGITYLQLLVDHETILSIWIEAIMKMTPEHRKTAVGKVWPKMSEHGKEDIRARIDEAKKRRGELPMGTKASDGSIAA